MRAEVKTHGGHELAELVRRSYEKGEIDYSLSPITLGTGFIHDGDNVVFCCRRGEREIELTEMFTDPDFDKVERKALKDIDFSILTLYHEKFKDLPVVFGPSHVKMPLAEVLSKAGKTQFHCSESEKFAHVTFFLNGGENQPFPGETDTCVPSLKGVPFDTKPELSLPEVADKVEEALGKYDFIVTNFANGDVIGHTANDAAKIEASGHVSKALEQVVEAAKKAGYVVAITADHGNIEILHTEKGKPHVAHTSNLVAFIMIDPLNDGSITLKDGSLKDIAPTVLSVMGIPQPEEMDGSVLCSDHDFGKDRKMLLIICDGWGLGDKTDNDAIFLGDTPYWDSLLENEAWSSLHASGGYVGLGDGKPGNSEAGHSNIGAGRVVPQDDIRLDSAIADGSFMQNQVLLDSIAKAKEKGCALHLIGLLTKKSSHGSIFYPLAVAEMAKELPEVYLHVIFDGRSTEPGSAPALLEELDEMIESRGLNLQVVDGVGRGIALDRDGNYGKVKLAYDNMIGA